MVLSAIGKMPETTPNTTWTLARGRARRPGPDRARPAAPRCSADSTGAENAPATGTDAGDHAEHDAELQAISDRDRDLEQRDAEGEQKGQPSLAAASRSRLGEREDDRVQEPQPEAASHTAQETRQHRQPAAAAAAGARSCRLRDQMPDVVAQPAEAFAADHVDGARPRQVDRDPLDDASRRACPSPTPGRRGRSPRSARG